VSFRPNPLPRFHRWRTNVLNIPLMAAATIVCGSISLLLSLVDKSGSAQHQVARIWARSLVFFAGSSLQVLGQENLRKYPVDVYASNHTS